MMMMMMLLLLLCSHLIYIGKHHFSTLLFRLNFLASGITHFRTAKFLLPKLKGQMRKGCKRKSPGFLQKVYSHEKEQAVFFCVFHSSNSLCCVRVQACRIASTSAHGTRVRQRARTTSLVCRSQEASQIAPTCLTTAHAYT